MFAGSIVLLRRDFIKGCAAAALANPLFASLRADAMTVVAIVDAHCHIFNGDDLPIVQFIEKVATGSHPRPPLMD